ncbi:hypothetical protein [Curtobacterium oceanosedimentum]|uniref:hypothetical protein n=1 Tax=Curtobacterium oceanosedimentum TaxID=465820 RepID=UPI00339090A1
MPWQKIDDQFGISQKVIRIPRKRRQQCIGLWTLVGNYAIRTLTDGIVEAHELDELDARDSDIDELVRVGLWHRPDHTCESCVQPPSGGITIHDFLEYHPSREQVLADRKSERDRKAAYRASKRSPSGTTDGTPAGIQAASGLPVPVPSQSRPVPTSGLDIDDETQVRPEVDARVRTDLVFDDMVQARALRAGAKDIRRLHGLLERAVRPVGPLSPMAAVLLIEAITNRARGEVQDVDAYIVIVARNPVDVQGLYQSEDLEFVSRQDLTDRSIA